MKQNNNGPPSGQKKNRTLAIASRRGPLESNPQNNSTENEGNSNTEEKGNIVVAVRVRPLNDDEIAAGYNSCCKANVSENSIVISKKEKLLSYLKSQSGMINEYIYDHAFDESVTQYQIYELTAKPLIEKVLKGFNATLFAYGATGAGKTYTMLGDLYKDDTTFSNSGAGIIPNCVRDLIQVVNQQKNLKDIYKNQISISVSYFEVYNEQVYDLLDSNGACLSVREDQEKGIVVVAGATEETVESIDQVMNLLYRGSKNRKTEATMANTVSSRSHAVFQLNVNQLKYSDRGQPCQTVSKLSLIDLAGSERASATNNRGIRLLEGANINKSLLALANCINTLSENSHAMSTRRTNVKYRDSKLTHLLKSSLEGQCYLVMIANINPSDATYEDSHNTLKYASRAKTIKLNPEALKEITKKSDFVERETRLRDENIYLKGKVAELEEVIDSLRLKVRELETQTIRAIVYPPKAPESEHQYSFDAVYNQTTDAIFTDNPIRPSITRKRSILETNENSCPNNECVIAFKDQVASDCSPSKKICITSENSAQIARPPSPVRQEFQHRSRSIRSISPGRKPMPSKRKSFIPRLSIKPKPRQTSPQKFSQCKPSENKRQGSPYCRMHGY